MGIDDIIRQGIRQGQQLPEDTTGKPLYVVDLSLINPEQTGLGGQNVAEVIRKISDYLLGDPDTGIIVLGSVDEVTAFKRLPTVWLFDKTVKYYTPFTRPNYQQ